MGINTNLNTAPYNDDFDADKQYIRVLFKPARAVQAREMTQLQSILQNQIERFGNNIYQEGTIIEGVNPTVDKNVNFVKINDQSGIDDLTIYASTDDVSYFIEGLSSGLTARIVAGANGFQSDAPDLKTFFVKYLQSVANQAGTDVKQFISGELLSVTREEDGVTTAVATVTANDGTDHVGESLAVQVTDGVIYQHGHFNYVAPQLIIASKYDIIPADISVGFNINESIVDSALDNTLLDNAQGFNNFNAPGADRLKLEPKLAVYDTTTRPESFFALLRIEKGQTVFVRGDTQFNSIKKELAKRTQDESGSYVVSGLPITTEKDSDGKFQAVIGAGRAYAFGFEINNIGKTRLEIDPSATTSTKSLQSTGVEYGGYLTVDVSSAGTDVESFNFSDRYKLCNSAQQDIGTCSIRNIEPVGNDKLRIYVYAVQKNENEQTTDIAFIYKNATTKTAVLSGNIVDANKGLAIFDTGRQGMKSVSSVVYTERQRKYYPIPVSSSSPILIPVEVNGQVTTSPITQGGAFAIDTSGEYVGATTVESVASPNTGISITFPAGKTLQYIYYNANISGVTQDTLTAIDVWVTTSHSAINNFASLGLPNAVVLNQVKDSEGKDVTSKFALQRNQNDAYYGLSYLTLKSGETLGAATATISANFTVLQRTVNGGYITPNSYSNITDVAEKLTSYTGRNGKTYNLLNSFDFRPYADTTVQYLTEEAGAASVNISSLQLDTLGSAIPVSSNSTILATQEYYLGRIDKLAIDKTQQFVIVKGQPADNPGKVVNDSVFGIADIFVPGVNMSVSKANPIRVERNTIKNYTMKDIESIEKRVDRVFDVLSLSLLESQTKDMFIPDASGNNRFKNGILVDQFKDLRVADITDGDFKASIESVQKYLAPAVTQFPIDLKVDSATSSNVVSYDDVTTLSSSSRETLLSQEYATSFRNCASNFYNYNGTVLMEPKFDAGYDVIENPAVTIDIDLAGAVLSAVDTIQQFVPLTSTTQTNSVQSEFNQQGNFSVASITDSFLTETLTSDTFNTTQNLGSFVTDFSMTPFMNSKVIKIGVSGLRPNTRHYFYFDEKPVSAHVAPGGIIENGISRSIKASDISAIGSRGAAVKSDQYGRLFAVFQLPGQTFLVGEADLVISDADQFNSIESAGTSSAKETYRAYGFTVNRTAIGSDVRSVDFDIESDTFSTSRELRVWNPPPRRRGGDPLAQTFAIQPAQAEYASYIFTDKLDLWFKKKSPASRRNGVTVQLREVENGYPTAKIVTFGMKHVDWSEISISDDASSATTVVFDNPVKLEVGKEYAIVVVPDATDPDYFIWTAKVGENSISDDSVQVSSDWGSGVLFTSTNNQAWESYQNEDVKFKLYKIPFSTNPGHIDLVANDMEFIDINPDTRNGNFIVDEYAYVSLSGNTFSGNLTSERKINVPSSLSDFSIVQGDLVIVEKQGSTHVSTVKSLTTVASNRVIVLSDLPPFTAGPLTISLGVGGKVTYFNQNKGNAVHIKESTSRTSAQYTASATLTGATSGATGEIVSLSSANVSYIQPFVMQQNTLRTSSELTLFKNTAAFDTANLSPGQGVPLHSNLFLTGEQRSIPSKQLLLADTAGNQIDRFRLRLDLSNNEYKYVTPVIDNALAQLQAYNYTMSNTIGNTSKYVSKKVVLQAGYPGQGLKVILSAFRPTGTSVDVQARFLYPSDPENYSDWVSLTNNNPDLYSSSANIKDFREFDYSFTEAATPLEYDAFQIKIIMKHDDANASTGLFPLVHDYRAIALT